MEFQHRRLAIGIAMVARHIGFAGNRGVGGIHGGAAANTGCGWPPAAIQPDAGQVHASAGLQSVCGIVLVDGGFAQLGGADALAVAHRPVNAVGRPQHGVGILDAAFLQRGTDASGGNRLPAVLCHVHNGHGDAQRGAQLLQAVHIPGGICAKGKVIAAEHRLGGKAFHQNFVDEIFRA